MGKKKKPPVEVWQIAQIWGMAAPRAFSGAAYSELQFVQARLVVIMGWELFCRPQDFSEFEVCDFKLIEGALDVLVRYAKNDPRGLTRAPRLQRIGGVGCVVELWERYLTSLGLRVLPGCTKMWGSPKRCDVCGPAFPAVWKHRGVREHRMSSQKASSLVKAIFIGLAEQGVMDMEDALEFSGKSCRCGGVTASAAEAVRDGVLQGHGGWLQRTSLRHYDVMKDSEKGLVSQTLGLAVQAEAGNSVKRWF
jgi:hypothetical protein